MCVFMFLWCVCWDGTGAMGGGGAVILAWEMGRLDPLHKGPQAQTPPLSLSPDTQDALRRSSLLVCAPYPASHCLLVTSQDLLLGFWSWELPPGF